MFTNLGLVFLKKNLQILMLFSENLGKKLKLKFKFKLY